MMHEFKLQPVNDHVKTRNDLYLEIKSSRLLPTLMNLQGTKNADESKFVFKPTKNKISRT